MDIYLSTNWNSRRHATGEAIVDEILSLGVAGVELGYHMGEPQVEGVRRRVASDALRVSSLHAYCPFPAGVPNGHPELYLIASPDDDERAMAIMFLQRTLNLASEVGARAVVSHAGRIDLSPSANELIAAIEDDGLNGPRYQKLLKRNQRRRARRIGKYLDALRRSLDTLLPRFSAAHVTLGLENLPAWESVPTEEEMLELVKAYAGSALSYWHDLGHGQVRANMGWINDHRAWAERLLPHTIGLHIHDVHPPAHDHLVPGAGKLPFEQFSWYGSSPVLKVLEPAPGTPVSEIQAGLSHLRKMWKE